MKEKALKIKNIGLTVCLLFFYVLPSISQNLDPEDHVEITTSSLSIYDGKDGMRGIKINDSIITEPIYDEIKFNLGSGFIVRKNGRYGYFNKNGIKKLTPIFDNIKSFGDKFLLVSFYNKEGLFDRNGRKIVSINYEQILAVNEKNQVIAKKDDSTIVFINKDKSEIEIDDFYTYKKFHIIVNDSRYALVTDSINTGFIYDSIVVGKYQNLIKKRNLFRNGNLIRFHKEIFQLIVCNNDYYGIIDSFGNRLVEINNDNIKDYYIYFEVTKNDKFGFYLKELGQYFEPKYTKVEFNYEGNYEYIKAFKGDKFNKIYIKTGGTNR